MSAKTTEPDLPHAIAKALLARWSIGTSSRFCDDPPDWDEAGEDEIADVVAEVLAAAGKLAEG